MENKFNYSKYRQFYKPGLLGIIKSKEDEDAHKKAENDYNQIDLKELQEYYKSIINDNISEIKGKTIKEYKRRINRIKNRYLNGNEEFEIIKYQNTITDNYQRIPKEIKHILSETRKTDSNISERLSETLIELTDRGIFLERLLYITEISNNILEYLSQYYFYQYVLEEKKGKNQKTLHELFRDNKIYQQMIERLIEEKLIQEIDDKDVHEVNESKFKEEGLTVNKALCALMYIFYSNDLLVKKTTKKDISNALRNTFNRNFSDPSLTKNFRSFQYDFESSNYRKFFYFILI